MTQFRVFLAVFLATLIAGCGVGILGWKAWSNSGLTAEGLTRAVDADGREHQIALISGRYHLPLRPSELHVAGVAASNVREEALGSKVLLWLRTPVQPGNLQIKLSGRGSKLLLPIVLQAVGQDSYADGTPDWMRLHAEEDRQAFRRWFTELAERMADTPGAQRPPEITDCASLLRYAYREALVRHDDRWYKQFPPEQMPALASVQQWVYPDTPLGVGLFRVRPGPYLAGDAENGGFAQFADAKTLMEDDSFRVSRDLRAARPGDLIFYRLLEQDSQYHSMIISGDHGEWVVYHTGPISGRPGEMRRVLLADLLQHPDPRWRPLASNANFLGVYRWNILREP